MLAGLASVASGSYLRRAVGIKMLKNKLSEYVRLAASGETVLVTDRDSVAELSPPRGTLAGTPDLEPAAGARSVESFACQ
jgi:antitoxin (DNA-binding transcriptional repressor) of toxin-antitoxin stability system